MLCGLGVEEVEGEAVFSLQQRKVVLWDDKMVILEHCTYAAVTVPHHQMLGRMALELDCSAMALPFVLFPPLAPLTPLHLSMGHKHGGRRQDCSAGR